MRKKHILFIYKKSMRKNIYFLFILKKYEKKRDIKVLQYAFSPLYNY